MRWVMRRKCLSELSEGWSSHLWVTDEGGVWSDHSNRWLKGTNNKGYRLFSVGLGSPQLLHRLVAMAFVSNPYGKKYVNHIDGDKDNNHYSNLEWVTRIENERHASQMGLNPCKLSDSDVSKIKVLLSKSKMSNSDIGEKFEVSPHTVLQINRGKTWSHVGAYKYPIRSEVRVRRRNYLSEERIEIVRQLLGSGQSYRKITAATGTARDTIKRIKDGAL